MEIIKKILSKLGFKKDKKKVNKPSRTTGYSTDMKQSMEEATMNYILSKYKKESFKIMKEHILAANIDGLNQDRMDELKKFLECVLLVVEDDFFKGHRLLKGRMVKIDQYLFSQYKKDPILKDNIYKVLMFANNKRFSNHLKENLTAYFALIEELGFEIIHFLEDYHKTMVELEKNPKASMHLKKNYGLKNFIKEKTDDYNYSQNGQSVQFLTTATEVINLKYKSPFEKEKKEVNDNDE